jgi:hypothetical protein
MVAMAGTDRIFGGSELLTVEIKNEQPVDLVDFTTSMMALAQEFQEFANASSAEDDGPSNIKLFVREMRSGSIIADLIPIAQQADWILDHKDVLGAFVGNLQELANYFLGTKGHAKEPTGSEAKRLAQILEPIAKDGGAQLNIQATDQAKVEIHNHFHLSSRDANAIQNGIRRFLGPDLPALEIRRDQLMTLEQVKNVAKSKTGDRAIIEAIWPKAVKVHFLSDEAKSRVLNLEENPLQKIFVVDVEVHSSGGKPALYRVIDVKDVIEKP